MGKVKRKSNQPAIESVTPLLAPLQALQSLISVFNDQGSLESILTHPWESCLLKWYTIAKLL
jgi:hypothetical protein